MKNTKQHPTIKMLHYLSRSLQILIRKQKLDLKSLGYTESFGRKKTTSTTRPARKPKAKPASASQNPPASPNTQVS